MVPLLGRLISGNRARYGLLPGHPSTQPQHPVGRPAVHPAWQGLQIVLPNASWLLIVKPCQAYRIATRDRPTLRPGHAGVFQSQGPAEAGCEIAARRSGRLMGIAGRGTNRCTNAKRTFLEMRDHP